jgi:hypothetical protein
MTTQLGLANSGEGTFNLTTNAYRTLLNFTPNPDGHDTIRVAWQWQTTATRTTVREEIDSLQRALAYAPEYQKNKVSQEGPVRLICIPDGENNTWQTEVYTGKLLPETPNQLTQEKGTYIATLDIWHAPFWEDTTEEQIAIGAGTGWQAFDNHEDGAGAVNSALLGDRTGQLVSPLRLHIRNTTAADAIKTAWIGMLELSESNFPTDPDLYLQGEDASGITGTTLDANSSDGGYGYHAFVSSDEVDSFTWTLSEALVEACHTQRFLVLARFPSGPAAGTLVRLKIKQGAYTLWQSEQYYLNGLGLSELGVVQIPPNVQGIKAQDTSALDLQLTFQISGGGTINIDHIQLLPVTSWAKLTAIVPVTQNQIIELDSADQVTRVDDGANSHLWSVQTEGPGLWPHPSRGYKLMLMHAIANGSAPITRTIEAKAYHNPRRAVP